MRKHKRPGDRRSPPPWHPRAGRAVRHGPAPVSRAADVNEARKATLEELGRERGLDLRVKRYDAPMPPLRPQDRPGWWAIIDGRSCRLGWTFLEAKAALQAFRGRDYSRRNPGATRRAAVWLRKVLTDAGGAMAAAEVYRKAEGKHGKVALYRARKRLGVQTRKDGMTGGWRWILPESAFCAGAQATNATEAGG